MSAIITERAAIAKSGLTEIARPPMLQKMLRKQLQFLVIGKPHGHALPHINTEEILKKSLNLFVSASLLGGAFALVGCSEAPKSEAIPAATPVALATVAPAEAPKPAGDLGKAKASLEKAVTELKAKNYTGAASMVDAARQELTAVATNSRLPVPVKESLAKASANLAPLKALIEKKDADAEEGLMDSLAIITKLNNMVRMMSGAGNMMSGAAKKPGAAAGAAKTEAEKMMPKKQ